MRLTPRLSTKTTTIEHPQSEVEYAGVVCQKIEEVNHNSQFISIVPVVYLSVVLIFAGKENNSTVEFNVLKKTFSIPRFE